MFCLGLIIGLIVGFILCLKVVQKFLLWLGENPEHIKKYCNKELTKAFKVITRTILDELEEKYNKI